MKSVDGTRGSDNDTINRSRPCVVGVLQADYAFTFKCVGMSRIYKAFSVQYVHSLWCFTGINTWERRIHSPLRLFLTPPTPVYLFLAFQI